MNGFEIIRAIKECPIVKFNHVLHRSRVHGIKTLRPSEFGVLGGGVYCVPDTHYTHEDYTQYGPNVYRSNQIQQAYDITSLLGGGLKEELMFNSDLISALEGVAVFCDNTLPMVVYYGHLPVEGAGE